MPHSKDRAANAASSGAPPPQDGGGRGGGSSARRNKRPPPRPPAASSAAPLPPGGEEEAGGLLKMSPFLEGGDAAAPQSSLADLFSLTDNDDVRFLFASGIIFAFLNGLTTPALAYIMSAGLSDLAGAAANNPYQAAITDGAVDADGGMDGVRRTALYFVVTGVYAFVTSFVQNMCTEVAAARTQRMLLTRWFGALLKQDAAFYDVYDPSVLAPLVLPASRRVRRGLGRKLGEGVQFGTAFAGGLLYALVSSWRIALVLLGTVPLTVFAVYKAYRYERDRPAAAREAYRKSGAARAAKGAVGGVRTVVGRNAGKEMRRRYEAGVEGTYAIITASLWRAGAVVSLALSSFMLLFCVFTLYGSYLLYEEVRATGCDPSGSGGATAATTCESSGAAVLGAMLGMAFAAQGLAQLPPVFDAIRDARAGCYPAMIAIRRTEGADAEEVIVASHPVSKKRSVRGMVDDGGGDDVESGRETRVRAILPRYVIDSSSQGGLRPKSLSGALSFRAVSFAYPTRPTESVLDGFNLSLEAGSTIALVGSGSSEGGSGGKSTVVSLLQRFYDPSFGVVALDGIDVRDLNIHYLRSKVRVIGPDPVVFETTVAENIRLGRMGATRLEIKGAAEAAGVHNFIMTLPDAYNSVIGDWGVQLTGAQMQRIAIARALISQPVVLIFDEATSALDRRSGEAVQDVIDELSSRRDRTTIIIPSRLSTIRHVDSIVVLERGRAVEMGNHGALLESAPGGHYRHLVERENASPTADDSFFLKRSSLGTDPPEGGGRRGSIADSHDLSFVKVGFAYPARPKKAVLSRFDLSVRGGELLALVGPRGGGKKTALALAARFYDPTGGGTVEYSGRDVKGLEVRWLRDQMRYLQLDSPMLNTTIARNIDPDAEASQERLERVSAMANVQDDILALPAGYETEVRDGGARLSRCFRQRVAIANALLKDPKVILLDESAVGTELDEAVQDALERLLTAKGRTAVVVAHRNSTVRAADRIALVVKGKVREIGTHDELMDRPGGQYRRVVEAQRTFEFYDVEALRRREVALRIEDEDEEEEDAMDAEEQVEEAEFKAYDYLRARRMAFPDWHFLTLGSLGSVIAGGVFPAWGLLFGYVVTVIYQRVPPCSSSRSDVCDASYESIANDARDKSIQYGICWIVIAAACLIGSTITFWGFGMARERLNKRVREASFAALMRQDIAYFDRRRGRRITSLLEDDVARIHVFMGEPTRIIVTNLTSLAAGLTIACLTMWPLALCSLAVFPLILITTHMEVSTFLDEGDADGANQGFDSPEGIVLETLLNIRTVSSLGIERSRYKDYQRALVKSDQTFGRMGLVAGFVSAFPPLVQQLTNALKYWWGGWLLFYYGYKYTFDEYVISLFSLFFALLSLGASATGVSNHEVCQESAGRVFYLLNRNSSIDTYPEEKESSVSPNPEEKGDVFVDQEIS